MAKTIRQKKAKSLKAYLTAAFTAAVLAVQSVNAAPPPPIDVKPILTDKSCVQNIDKDQTKYKNYDDFVLASAYARFIEKQGRDPAIVHAILEASESTGVDFELMMAKAILESDLGRYRKPINVNGSARGMYQYIDTTWLTVFSWYAHKYEGGIYADLAKAVKFDSNKKPYVEDPRTYKKILDLRHDHYVASFIKAMQIKYDEKPNLRKALGRAPTITDYYIAHFLGIPRARVFFKQLNENSNAKAADLFKREARYNRSVFYDHNNNPRNYSEVYKRLERIIRNRVAGVEAISKNLLQNESCTPPLKKGVQPEPTHILHFNI